MHRIFVAALVAAVLIVPARAADVPVKGPVYKAAPAAYDWRGFYIGAHAGGIWVDGDFTAIPGGTGSATGSSFIGGALIGYNWRLAPNWIWGVEADFGFASADSATIVVGPGVVQSELQWNAHLRARLGYTMNRTVFFIAGGLALAEVEQFLPAGPARVSNTLAGYSIGAGIDHAFAARWVGRIEYLYDSFSEKNYNYVPFGGGLLASSYDSHTVRGALIYRW